MAGTMYFNHSFIQSNASSIITDYGFYTFDDDDSTPIFDLFLENLNLVHKRLTLEDLETVQLRFLNSEDQKLNRRELRGLFKQFSIYLEDELFETLFLKV
jgi:hypothetical protein